ncbi:hypothetical protein, partial [Tolypothrix sp. VBCCA 56010]|uniref:hypothetical protein n=1 Tax=Tolypothrix sp. VBCCA 56010 TaxID=3137731 RepID=UPI003D7C8A8B
GKNANAQCDRAPSRRATVHPTPRVEWAFPPAFCKSFVQEVSNEASDNNKAKKLWDLSAKLVGIA